VLLTPRSLGTSGRAMRASRSVRGEVLHLRMTLVFGACRHAMKVSRLVRGEVLHFCTVCLFFPLATSSCSAEVLLCLLRLCLRLSWFGWFWSLIFYCTPLWGFPPSARCSAAELVGFLVPCGRPCPTFGAKYQSVLQLVVRSDPGRGSSLTVASLHCMPDGI
jgi:hypothetical protein